MFPLVYFDTVTKTIERADSPANLPVATPIVILETSKAAHAFEDSLRLAKRAFDLGQQASK